MIGTKFSKYFKQDILDRNQTLKPVIIIPEIEEVWGASDAIEHKKLRAKYSFTINQEKLTQRWPYDGYEDKPLEQISCLKSVSNVKIANDWDRKTLKINTLRFQLYNHYDHGRKLSEIMTQLRNKEVRLYYKSPTTNIINYYPEIGFDGFTSDQSDDFSNYDCPFVFKGYITRVTIKKDVISVTAEDNTQHIMGKQLVPSGDIEERMGDYSKITYINPSFDPIRSSYPLVYGYVDRSPVIQAQYTGDDVRDLTLITGEISGHYPTGKIPAIATNRSLPSGNKSFLYVEQSEDFLILEHMAGTTFNNTNIKNGFINLYLTGGDLGGNASESLILPSLLGSDGSDIGFGIYDMVGYQQRMVEAAYGSYGGILGIADVTEGSVSDPLDALYGQLQELYDNNGSPRIWYRAENAPMSGANNLYVETSYMSDTAQRGDGMYIMLKLDKGVDNELVNIYNNDNVFIGNTFIMGDYFSHTEYPANAPAADSSTNVTSQGYFITPISTEVLEQITAIRGHYDETNVVGEADSLQASLQALLVETPEDLDSLVSGVLDDAPDYDMIAPPEDPYSVAAISTPENGFSGMDKYWGSHGGPNGLFGGGGYQGVNGLYFGAKTRANNDPLVGESPDVHDNLILFEFYPPYWGSGTGSFNLSYEQYIEMNNIAFLHSVKVDDIRTQKLYGSFVGRRNNKHTEWIDPTLEYAEPAEDFEFAFEDLTKNSDGTSPDFATLISAYTDTFKNIVNTDTTLKTKPYEENLSSSMSEISGESDIVSDEGTFYTWYNADWSGNTEGEYDELGFGYAEHGGEPHEGDGMYFSEFNSFLDGDDTNSTIETQFTALQESGLGVDAPMFTDFTLFRNFIYKYCQIPMRMAHDFNFLYDTQGHNINMLEWFGHPLIIKHMLAYIYQEDLSDVVMPSGSDELSYYFRFKGLNVSGYPTGEAYMIQEKITGISTLMEGYMTETPLGYTISTLDEWTSNFYVYMDDVIQAFNHCLRDLESKIIASDQYGNAVVHNSNGTIPGVIWHYDGGWAGGAQEIDAIWPGRDDFDNWVNSNGWYYGLSHYETGTQLSGLRQSLMFTASQGESEEIITGEPYVTTGVIQKPSDIVLNIIEKEMGFELGDNYENVDKSSIDASRLAHLNWNLGFTIINKTNGKKLIEDILKESKSYPTFKSDGKFGLVTIKEQYDEEDVNKTIKESDIIKYGFSQTKIEDIITSIKAFYNYDHGTKTYKSFEYQNILDYGTYYAYDHLSDTGNSNDDDPGGGGAFNMSLDEIRNDKKGYLELTLKYHVNETTVKDFLQHTIMNNALPHNICDLTLSLNNIDLEIGDIIKLPLINKERIPSVGSQRELLHLNSEGEIEEGASMYESNYPIDYTRLQFRNGIEIYPYWVIMEKETGINNIKIKAFQLHNLVPITQGIATMPGLSYEQEADIPAAPIVGNMNMYNFNYEFSSGEPMLNWNYNPDATEHQGPEIMYFDVNGDGVLNVVDIVTVVNHILDPGYNLGPEPLERLNTFALDGSPGDNIVNVVDIVTLVDLILG